MKIILLRHAIAVERTAWRRADAERPLTPEGIEKMKKVARGMRKLGLEFDWILSSPFRRAFDTAQIVAKEFGAKKRFRVSRSLAATGDPKNLVRHLARDYRSWESVLLVGHEPYLSRLVSVLVTGAADAQIELKKGGVCILSADSLDFGRCARLETLLSPRQIRSFR